MNFVSEWFNTAKSVILSPSETLRNEDRRNGFGYPLKFMIFSLFLAAIINTTATGLGMITTPMMSLDIVGLVTYFLTNAVGGPVGMAVVAGVTHIFAYLFGARKGYSKTLAALAYGTAVTPIVAIFTLLSVFVGPAALVGLLVGLWALQIDYRGLQHFREISSMRAGLALIAPILLGFVLAIGSAMLAWAPLLL